VYLDERGKEVPMVMGSYGIGPARIAAAAIEQNNDKDGIIWPKGIAPFDVEIISLDMNNPDIQRTAESLCRELVKERFEVFLDDRQVSPGVKFKDADLIGIPWQVIIGDKGVKGGVVEFKSRKTKEIRKLNISEAAGKIVESL
jgi:prolyl-tRNA synthetase